MLTDYCKRARGQLLQRVAPLDFAMQLIRCSDLRQRVEEEEMDDIQYIATNFSRRLSLRRVGICVDIETVDIRLVLTTATLGA